MCRLGWNLRRGLGIYKNKIFSTKSKGPRAKTWVIKIVAKYGLHDQMDPTIQTLKEKDYKLDKERVKE